MRRIVSEGFWCIELNPERWLDWKETDWDRVPHITEYDFIETAALSYGHHILITDLRATRKNLNRLAELCDELRAWFGDDAIDDSDENDEDNPEAGQ